MPHVLERHNLILQTQEAHLSKLLPATNYKFQLKLDIYPHTFPI